MHAIPVSTYSLFLTPDSLTRGFMYIIFSGFPQSDYVPTPQQLGLRPVKNVNKKDELWVQFKTIFLFVLILTFGSNSSTKRFFLKFLYIDLELQV